MNRTNKAPLVTALVLAGVVLSSACTFALQKPQTTELQAPKEVRLTEKQGACGSGVDLNVGDTLELVMESNLAGYAWDIGFNVPAVLKVTGEPSHDPGSNPGATATFHLTAVAEGQEMLRLLYHSVVDATAPHSRICDVQVMVSQ